MIDRENGSHIGEIGYTVTDVISDGKFVHLGYFTYKTFWNKGYVTEALTEVIRFAFEDDNVYKISAGCSTENVGSARVMQKCGLIKEVGCKEIGNHDTELTASVEYNLLKSEWEQK